MPVELGDVHVLYNKSLCPCGKRGGVLLDDGLQDGFDLLVLWSDLESTFESLEEKLDSLILGRNLDLHTFFLLGLFVEDGERLALRAEEILTHISDVAFTIVAQVRAALGCSVRVGANVAVGGVAGIGAHHGEFVNSRSAAEVEALGKAHTRTGVTHGWSGW